MDSIADYIRLETPAVAIFRADKVPEGAFIPSKGCSIPGLFVRCARTGDVCAADREHIFCHGALSGFGFGGIPDREHSSWAASDVPADRKDEMKHGGKKHFASPEIATLQLNNIKDYGDGSGCIVFKRLDDALSAGDPIEVVAYLVDPTRISALAQLAGFSRNASDPAVVMPYGHACQHLYAIPRAEGESEHPRAVLGMTDIYARRYVRPDEMTFAVPYSLYKRMAEDAPKSFLASEKWAEQLDKCL
jgi:hypothetical protein